MAGSNGFVGIIFFCFFTLNCFVDFFAVYANFFWCVYAQAYLIAADINNSYFYIITDHNLFILLSAKNQHL